MKVKITLKNYRCFEDTSPAVFELDKGFTSFVGVNNAGKSALIKFFYEFKNIWQTLSNLSLIAECLEREVMTVDYNGIHDVEEIFCNTNNRDLFVRIELLETLFNSELKTIELYISRSNPTQAKLNLFGANNKKAQKYANYKIVADKNKLIAKDAFAAPYENARRIIIFEDTTQFLDLMKNFHNSLYIGPFRNAITAGSGREYDLELGTQFISTWDEWKTGKSKIRNIAIGEVIKDIQEIFSFKSLDISASNSLKTLHVTINHKPYKLNEIGSGIAQFIILLGNAATRQPAYIFIDEPESHLHPALQLKLLTSLHKHASQGVLFSTHSTGLARSISNKIYSIKRRDNISEIKDFEKVENLAEFLGELGFSSYQELGFNKILLVEGPTDTLTMRQFLRKKMKDNDFIILPLGGEQIQNLDIESQLQELKRITTQIFCIIDSEKKTSEEQLTSDRTRFKEICERNQIKICILERRAIENYMEDYAIKLACGSRFKQLTDYEDFSGDKKWGKSNNWKIAKEMNWQDIKNTDLGKFLEEI
jgi:AAA15 family ATPase/GTPase